jgi:TrmH family RNA methyltransferase
MRRLRRSKGDRALLEGPHLLAEALDAGVALELVLATPEMLAGEEGRRLAARLAVPPLEVAGEALATLADADSPRGIAAIAHLPRAGAASLPLRAGGAGGIYLYLDGLQDPGNLGALARVAEAAGVAGLALAPGSVHPNHPRALRGSAGSLLRLPAAVGVTPAELDRRLAESGSAPRWIALATRGGSSLWSDDWTGPAAAGAPLVLAVGAEGPGLSPDAAARAVVAVTIPLAPPVESLNAVVAAALVLFELRRRAGRAGQDQPGTNSDSSR